MSKPIRCITPGGYLSDPVGPRGEETFDTHICPPPRETSKGFKDADRIDRIVPQWAPLVAWGGDRYVPSTSALKVFANFKDRFFNLDTTELWFAGIAYDPSSDPDDLYYLLASILRGTASMGCDMRWMEHAHHGMALEIIFWDSGYHPSNHPDFSYPIIRPVFKEQIRGSKFYMSDLNSEAVLQGYSLLKTDLAAVTDAVHRGAVAMTLYRMIKVPSVPSVLTNDTIKTAMLANINKVYEAIGFKAGDIFTAILADFMGQATKPTIELTLGGTKAKTTNPFIIRNLAFIDDWDSVLSGSMISYSLPMLVVKALNSGYGLDGDFYFRATVPNAAAKGTVQTEVNTAAAAAAAAGVHIDTVMKEYKGVAHYKIDVNDVSEFETFINIGAIKTLVGAVPNPSFGSFLGDIEDARKAFEFPDPGFAGDDGFLERMFGEKYTTLGADGKDFLKKAAKDIHDSLQTRNYMHHIGSVAHGRTFFFEHEIVRQAYKENLTTTPSDLLKEYVEVTQGATTLGIFPIQAAFGVVWKDMGNTQAAHVTYLGTDSTTTSYHHSSLDSVHEAMRKSRKRKGDIRMGPDSHDSVDDKESFSDVRDFFKKVPVRPENIIGTYVNHERGGGITVCIGPLVI